MPISSSDKTRIANVVFISDFLPRQCGIATFTAALCESLTAEMSGYGRVDVAAMDDQPEGYNYPDCVKFQVNDHNRNDYVRAAEFININGYDLAIVQHEYGIFGGKNGAYLLRLLRGLRMPIIATLHTVLTEPTEGQREVLLGLAELADRLVVMSHRAEEILQRTFKIPQEKIAFIPHGIPDVPFSDPIFHKELFDVEQKKVILTFGLLGPSKGLEVMIDAMPAVVKEHPDAVYLILGATHPHVVRQSGESYRQSLYQQAKRQGVDDHIIFHNRFVGKELLLQYLSIADIYCTPYPNAAQITSGTLAYAMGSGKAVVSTPYWYAEELLADDRGRLIGFGDVEALGKAVIELLNNDHERNVMRKQAYQYCRSMVWPEVARNYLELGNRIIGDHAAAPEPHPSRDPVDILDKLPEPTLRHLRILTDDNGMLQHAHYTTPDRNHGYCVDDNARALIVSCMQHHRTQDESLLPLIQTYLSFLLYGYNAEQKRFRNQMSFHRTWEEEVGSEDAHGRALWALGMAVKYQPTEDMRDMSAGLFTRALGVCEALRSPRALAFALVGAHAYLEVYGGDSDVRRVRTALAQMLYSQFKGNSTQEWPWLEDSVTYANGIIPMALMLAGQWIPELEMHAMGVQALSWLLETQTAPEGHLSVIGNEKWLIRDGERSKFDQQAIEPMCLILACCEAFRSTRNEHWLKEGRRCLDWFLGSNDLNDPLCDFRTGGCRDGLHPEGVNANQGAESTLAWLISLLAMHEISELIPSEVEAPQPSPPPPVSSTKAGGKSSKAGGKSAKSK